MTLLSTAVRAQGALYIAYRLTGTTGITWGRCAQTAIGTPSGTNGRVAYQLSVVDMIL